MKLFVVHAHPEPASFNGALTEGVRAFAARAGHSLAVSDLYRDGWDPVSDRRNFVVDKDARTLKLQQEELHAAEHKGFALDIAREQRRLLECDVMIWQFPLWWFGLPAILKGWVDRVFAMGFAYGGGRWYDRGPFAGKRALLSLTTGGPRGLYEPDGINGDLEQILFPIHHGMLAFTGFTVLAPHVVYSPARMSDAERAEELQRWQRELDALDGRAQLSYPPLSAYGPDLRLARSNQG
jgi:NAD(P)H dehydrogenase (quinone)